MTRESDAKQVQKEFIARMERADERELQEISRYMIQQHGGKQVAYFGACHAALSRYNDGIAALVTAPSAEFYGSEDESLWCGDRHNEHQWDMDQHVVDARMWFKWLFKESPWKDVYMTNPSLPGMSKKGIQINVSFPANLAMLGIIATRTPHEYPIIVRNWANLVRKGADPLIASVYAECIKVKEAKSGELIAEGHPNGDIHHMYDGAMFNKEGKRRLMAWDLAKVNPPLCENGDYNGIHKLFRNADSWEEKNRIYKEIAEIKPNLKVKIKTFVWDGPDKTKTVEACTYDYLLDEVVKLTQAEDWKHGRTKA